jgi:hypothetical protein
MVLVDERAHSGHEKVIRCYIKQESVEKFRDVENQTISEKLQRIPL